MVLLEKYLELVKDYKFSDLYNTWAFLTTVAATLERRCFLNENLIGYLYPTMYTVFVGPPASKKTTAARIPADLFLRSMENGPILSSNQLTPATLVDELKAAGESKYTTKQSALFALAGEFSVLISDIGGGSVIDLLLDFYDTRKPGEQWTKHTKKWGVQTMPNPALTLLSCTTPQHLIQSRLTETVGLGFTRRILFVVEPRLILGAKRFPSPNPDLLTDIQAEFIRMYQLEGAFALTPQAQDALDGAIDRNNKWLLDNPGTTFMTNYHSVKMVHIRKIALCLSAMRSNKKLIDAQDVIEAERLVTGLEETMPQAVGMQTNRNDAGLAWKIMDRIPIGGGTTSDEKLLKSFIQDGQFVPNGSELREALSGLIRAGQISAVLPEKQGGDVLYRRKVQI